MWRTDNLGEVLEVTGDPWKLLEPSSLDNPDLPRHLLLGC